jgi:hypothetical protein
MTTIRITSTEFFLMPIDMSMRTDEGGVLHFTVGGTFRRAANEAEYQQVIRDNLSGALPDSEIVNRFFCAEKPFLDVSGKPINFEFDGLYQSVQDIPGFTYAAAMAWGRGHTNQGKSRT